MTSSIQKEHLNPETLFSSLPFGFTQVVTSRGGKTVHVSGQVALDANMEIVGKGDLGVQANQALENVKRALEAAGAALADVVRMRIYVVNFTPDYIDPIASATRAFFPEKTPPASTLIGVQSLALSDLLIEIEVTAVVDE